MSKLSNGNQKISNTELDLCICGTVPELNTITSGQLFIQPLIEYKCPKCGIASETRWLPTQGSTAIGAWNNTMKIMKGRIQKEA